MAVLFISMMGSVVSRISVPPAAVAAVIQKRELNSSGFLVNEDKSYWDPMQVGEWLGFVINTIAMTSQIPKAKVRKLKSLRSSAIRVASYLGSLVL